MQMVIRLNASHNKTFLLVIVNVTCISSSSSSSSKVDALVLLWRLIITYFIYVRCGYKFTPIGITMFVNADKCMFKIWPYTKFHTPSFRSPSSITIKPMQSSGSHNYTGVQPTRNCFNEYFIIFWRSSPIHHFSAQYYIVLLLLPPHTFISLPIQI